MATDDNSPPRVFVGTSRGWFTSSDGGSHFSAATGLPSRTAVFGGLVDEPDSVAFAATDKGVFRSSDLGASFAPTNLNFSPCFDRLGLDTLSGPHIVYVTCDAGVIASYDGLNLNFTFGTLPPLPFAAPFGLLVDNTVSTAPALVFLGVQSQFFSYLSESKDGGVTFNLTSLGAQRDESIPVLLDPTTTPETIFVHDSWEHDATITELSRDGSRIVFSTELGGSDDESGTAIAIRGGGDEAKVYVTGITFSSDFPTTPGAVQKMFGGPFGGFVDGFVAKLGGDDSEDNQFTGKQ